MRKLMKEHLNNVFSATNSLLEFSCVNLKFINAKRMCPTKGQNI